MMHINASYINEKVYKLFKKMQPHLISNFMPWFVLGISLFMTLILYIAINNLEIQKSQTEFDSITDEIKQNIEKKLNQYMALISGAKGFFSASQLVELKEWELFVSAQNINEEFPGIQGLGFIKYLGNEKDITSFTQFMNSQGIEDYKIWPEGKRDEYYPIAYLEPQDNRNKRAIGYDVYSEPIRRQALDIAEATGKNTITGKIILVQEIGKEVQFGFLMMQPVYDNGKSIKTDAERKENIVGFVYAPFRMNDLMNVTLKSSLGEHIDLKIYDGKEESQNLFFAKDSIYSNQDGTMSKTSTLTFGQKTWTLVFHDSKPNTDSSLSDMMLAIGSSISVSLFFIFYFITKNQEIEKRKGEFSNMIQHELKTPIVPIITYCKMFKKSMFGKMDKEQIDAITVIEKNAKKLDNTLSNIIDMRKIATNQMKFEINDLSLDEFFSEIESDYKNMLENKGCQFTTICEKNLSIKTDRTRLRQVYDKILDNAIQFVPKKDGRIEIGCKKENEKIIFYIKDNGISIPKNRQSDLFKDFSQISSGHTRTHGGIGLSLAICKGIVEGLGGKIWIESEEGKGTSVYFTIPKNNP